MRISDWSSDVCSSDLCLPAMRIDQQPSYVLHARPYRETSLLLECLTREHGRLGVVARGVRGERARLRRAQLETFQSLTMASLERKSGGEGKGVSRLVDSGGRPTIKQKKKN